MPGVAWSEQEVLATIDAYFRLYDAVLRGAPINKAAEYRALNAAFPARTEKAFERKMQNISACLDRLNLPWIEGLLPAGNFQTLLLTMVTERVLRRRAEIESFADHAPPAVALHGEPDPSSRVPPPLRLGDPTSVATTGVKIDYAEREASNRILGRSGEEWVVRLERGSLELAGRADLAKDVEHTAVIRGDGYGYDVRSFDASSGREKYIEVKTTRAGIRTPFFLTPNEVRFSGLKAESFALYRLHQFGLRTKFYALAGDLTERCELHPSTFRAWPRSA